MKYHVQGHTHIAIFGYDYPQRFWSARLYKSEEIQQEKDDIRPLIKPIQKSNSLLIKQLFGLNVEEMKE